MKIKAASAATGLTERTIRFYTERGLLSPADKKSAMGGISMIMGKKIFFP